MNARLGRSGATFNVMVRGAIRHKIELDGVLQPCLATGQSETEDQREPVLASVDLGSLHAHIRVCIP